MIDTTSLGAIGSGSDSFVAIAAGALESMSPSSSEKSKPPRRLVEKSSRRAA